MWLQENPVGHRCFNLIQICIKTLYGRWVLKKITKIWQYKFRDLCSHISRVVCIHYLIVGKADCAKKDLFLVIIRRTDNQSDFFYLTISLIARNNEFIDTKRKWKQLGRLNEYIWFFECFLFLVIICFIQIS